jgi:hypothetical protein
MVIKSDTAPNIPTSTKENLWITSVDKLKKLLVDAAERQTATLPHWTTAQAMPQWSCRYLVLPKTPATTSHICCVAAVQTRQPQQSAPPALPDPIEQSKDDHYGNQSTSTFRTSSPDTTAVRLHLHSSDPPVLQQLRQIFWQSLPI